jgi:hypothetical protein
VVLRGTGCKVGGKLINAPIGVLAGYIADQLTASRTVGTCVSLAGADTDPETQRRTTRGPNGRDRGVVRHHFDIGVVSVFAKFVIWLRILRSLEQSYASPAIMRTDAG